MESTITDYELVNMIRKDQHINADDMNVWSRFYVIVT